MHSRHFNIINFQTLFRPLLRKLALENRDVLGFITNNVIRGYLNRSDPIVLKNSPNSVFIQLLSRHQNGTDPQISFVVLKFYSLERKNSERFVGREREKESRVMGNRDSLRAL